MTYFGNLFREIWPSEQFLYWNKYYFNRFLVPREINFPLCSVLTDRCFCWFPAAMLVPIRMGTNMAFSIQISINLGKKLLRISCRRKSAVT